MALNEACQVWIEQRIQEELETKGNGTSLRAIGRMIAAEVEKVFETKVKPDTIFKKVQRLSSGTNVPPQPTTCNNEEIEENQSPRPHRATGDPKGGEREGAGRPPKHRPMMANYPNPAEIISPSFKSAYELFFEEIRKSKSSGWKTTEKKVVLQYIQYLNDLATY